MRRRTLLLGVVLAVVGVAGCGLASQPEGSSSDRVVNVGADLGFDQSSILGAVGSSTDGLWIVRTVPERLMLSRIEVGGQVRFERELHGLGRIGVPILVSVPGDQILLGGMDFVAWLGPTGELLGRLDLPELPVSPLAEKYMPPAMRGAQWPTTISTDGDVAVVGLENAASVIVWRFRGGGASAEVPLHADVEPRSVVITGSGEVVVAMAQYVERPPRAEVRTFELSDPTVVRSQRFDVAPQDGLGVLGSSGGRVLNVARQLEVVDLEHERLTPVHPQEVLSRPLPAFAPSVVGLATRGGFAVADLGGLTQYRFAEELCTIDASNTHGPGSYPEDLEFDKPYPCVTEALALAADGADNVFVIDLSQRLYGPYRR